MDIDLIAIFQNHEYNTFQARNVSGLEAHDERFIKDSNPKIQGQKIKITQVLKYDMNTQLS